MHQTSVSSVVLSPSPMLCQPSAHASTSGVFRCPHSVTARADRADWTHGQDQRIAHPPKCTRATVGRACVDVLLEQLQSGSNTFSAVAAHATSPVLGFRKAETRAANFRAWRRVIVHLDSVDVRADRCWCLRSLQRQLLEIFSPSQSSSSPLGSDNQNGSSAVTRCRVEVTDHAVQIVFPTGNRRTLRWAPSLNWRYHRTVVRTCRYWFVCERNLSDVVPKDWAVIRPLGCDRQPLTCTGIFCGSSGARPNLSKAPRWSVEHRIGDCCAYAVPEDAASSTAAARAVSR